MINRFISERPWANLALQLIVVVFSGLCIGVSLNVFLIPGNIYSGGVTGVAQLITYFTNQTALASILTMGNLFFILNIPLLILSYFKLGRSFTVMTLLVVAASSVATNVIPTIGISENPLLNAITGGVISGLAGGLTIKVGMSGGGLDIITIVLSKMFSMNVGVMSFTINLFIIAAAGMLFGWEYALYTLISFYVVSRMMDAIHTNEQRLTVFVVTNKAEEVTNSIFTRIVRGVTVLEGQGGFSKDKRDVLMIVINRYEMHDLQIAIAEADTDAFINIIQSTKVSGRFLTRDQQKAMRKEVKETEASLALEADTVVKEAESNTAT